MHELNHFFQKKLFGHCKCAISKNNIESISGIINFDEQLKEDVANAKKYVPNKIIFNA